MVRKTLVAVLMVLCVGYGVMSGQLQAPPAGPVQPIFKESPPDLVIEQVTYEPVPGSSYHHFTILIKNVGTGDATTTHTAMMSTFNAAGHDPVWLCRVAETPPIAAGCTTSLLISVGTPYLPKGCYIIVVDAPVAGSPLGQRFEGPGDAELNNGFIFFLNPDVPGPQTFKNPAASE